MTPGGDAGAQGRRPRQGALPRRGRHVRGHHQGRRCRAATASSARRLRRRRPRRAREAVLAIGAARRRAEASAGARAARGRRRGPDSGTERRRRRAPAGGAAFDAAEVPALAVRNRGAANHGTLAGLIAAGLIAPGPIIVEWHRSQPTATAPRARLEDPPAPVQGQDLRLAGRLHEGDRCHGEAQRLPRALHARRDADLGPAGREQDKTAGPGGEESGRTPARAVGIVVVRR